MVATDPAETYLSHTLTHTDWMGDFVNARLTCISAFSGIRGQRLRQQADFSDFKRHPGELL